MNKDNTHSSYESAPESGSLLRVAIAQVNLTVGDISGNTKQVIEYTRKARDDLKADVVLFPELTLTGYPPEDLLLRADLYQRIDTALAEIEKASHGIDVVIGYPFRGMDNKIYNACGHLQNGVLVGRYFKQELPNYGVFDEKRYFSPGDGAVLARIKGVKVAFTICEDIWFPGPMRVAAEIGKARLMFNINASPYHADKIDEREALLATRAREGNMPIVYVNLVGGQDELVFDGHSLVVDAQGETVFRAPAFQTGLFLVMFETAPVVKPLPDAALLPLPAPEESIYQALVTGVRDYVDKNGFRGAVLGLSGGIDSALTLAIAVDALGADRVEAVLMPSRYTADMSIEDASAQAETLGIIHHIIPIEPVFSTFLESLKKVFAGQPPDVTEENIQARCRGVLLMAISNKTGKVVLTTGNKSEMAMGYATLYGDMAGGFAPLKDVIKGLVYYLAEWRNRKWRSEQGSRGTKGEAHGTVAQDLIPERVLTRPPSAELAPDQKDEDFLPPYPILDEILERYVEYDHSPEEIIDDGFDPETVAKVTGMVLGNEYKRRQAAPGVRITQRAFGRDRRYPITSGYGR
uniref:Glutamine-dependent NAD(+) synthetase n=1 Tax=Candidatus Kentrum sp. MB TaxID=2138164 RepID=A0A451BFZ5_9GAMM|nr:MAG: NAD+ synthase (glutamine-hydrolysing) [Candidatus Kentron sp. MB]VFK77192.1 MAG: NAD+ synthase (glutamine-hydrolysing) [Candidatus Kentron sp. MB]